MQIKELGAIEGQVLLYGGPYSNLEATTAVLDWADRAAIPVARRICTGDVVAYCGDPVATTALVRRRGGHVVAGNCEKQLAAEALDCGCGFEDGSACDLLSAGWYAYATNHSSADMRAWMGDCPDLITFTQAGRRFVVIHGGVTDIARFLWPTDTDAAFAPELTRLQGLVGPFDAVIAGHCGVPFQRRIGAIDWINPGVIGMPPNSGQSTTHFATLDKGQAQIHDLTYPAVEARMTMERVGLTQGYHKALTNGWWPSEDVLPEALRRRA